MRYDNYGELLYYSQIEIIAARVSTHVILPVSPPAQVI